MLAHMLPDKCDKVFQSVVSGSCEFILLCVICSSGYEKHNVTSEVDREEGRMRNNLSKCSSPVSVEQFKVSNRLLSLNDIMYPKSTSLIAIHSQNGLGKENPPREISQSCSNTKKLINFADMF